VELAQRWGIETPVQRLVEALVKARGA
jgi:hypothetical protein